MTSNHQASNGTFAGLGIEAYKLATIASGFRVEAMGMRLTRKAPKMATVVARDYGVKINGDKKQIGELFKGMATRLQTAILNKETDHLDKLVTFQNTPEFFPYLKSIL